MTYKFKVQSASDIITNSSSATFSIESDIPEKQLRELVNKFLIEQKGLTLEEIEKDESLRGNIWRDPTYIHLDFPAMCNWDDDELMRFLEQCFGEGNVIRE